MSSSTTGSGKWTFIGGMSSQTIRYANTSTSTPYGGLVEGYGRQSGSTNHGLGDTVFFNDSPPGTVEFVSNEELIPGATLTFIFYAQAYDSEGKTSSDTISSFKGTKYIFGGRTFAVSYDTNGGSGSISSQSYTPSAISDTYYDITISKTKPTKSGYQFTGWKAKVDGKTASTVYSAGGSYSIKPSSEENPTIVFVAQWAKTTTYRLYFDANGGTSEPDEQSQESADGSATFTIPTTTPVWAGRVFKGWSKSSNTNKIEYYPGDTINVSSTSTTLYAVWSHTYTLSYNANGGTGAPGATTVATLWKEWAITVEPTAGKVVPEREGFIFLGWSKSNTASTPTYLPETEITLQADNPSVTLFAVWQEIMVEHTTIRTKVSGGWKESQAFVKVAGIWKEAKAAFVKVNNQWKGTTNE